MRAELRNWLTINIIILIIIFTAGVDGLAAGGMYLGRAA